MNPDHPKLLALKTKHAEEIAKLEAELQAASDIEFATGLTPESYKLYVSESHLGTQGTITVGEWVTHATEKKAPLTMLAHLLVTLPPVPLIKQTNGWTRVAPASYVDHPKFEGGTIEPIAPVTLAVDAACAGSIDHGPVVTLLEWTTRLNAGLFHVRVYLSPFEVCSVTFVRESGGRLSKPIVKDTQLKFHPRWCAVVGDQYPVSNLPLARDSNRALTRFDMTKFSGGDGIHYGHRFVFSHPDPDLDVVGWARQVATGGIR